MIRSSVFTFDESSVWDPKVIRENLNIPEDQLNILRNLPEWSKGTDDSNTLRIEKDSICENSQATKLISDTILERNKDIKQNLQLFDENFEARRNILGTYKLNAGKLSRSTSLFEIDKIGKISSGSSSLKSSLSVPNIHLFLENQCSKNLNFEFRSKDSPPEKHSSSLIKSIYLPVTKKSGINCLPSQTNTGISKSERKGETYIEKSEMEVDSQLPLAIPCCVDKIRNNETDIEILVENNSVSTSLSLKSPSKLNLPPSNQPASSVTNVNKFDSRNSIVETKVTELPKLHSPNLCDKNEINMVEETIPSNNCNSDVSKKITKLAEHDCLTSCEKNEPDVNIVKETDVTKVNSASDNKIDETNIDFQERAKANETYDQSSESLIKSKELSALKVNQVSSNEPENKISSDSNCPKLDVQNSQQTIHQDISNNKLEFAQTLSIKRKLESKNRSSKKRKSTREKQGLEERSLKKAGEICYSAENIKIMLDIMKQFS